MERADNNNLNTKNKSNKSGKKETVFTPETFGVVLLIFSTLLIVCLISRDAVFSAPGLYVSNFLYGFTGLLSYPVLIATLIVGISLLTGKQIIKSSRFYLYLSAFITATFIVHAITMIDYVGLSYGEYLKTAYEMGANGIKSVSGGGLLLSVFSYLLSSVLTNVGTFIVLSALLLTEGYFIIRPLIGKSVKFNKNAETEKGSFVVKDTAENDIVIEGEKSYPVSGVNFDAPYEKASSRLFVNNPEDFAFKTKKDLRQEEKQKEIADKKPSGVSYSETYGNDLESKINYVKTPPKFTFERHDTTADSGEVRISRPITDRKTERFEVGDVSNAIPIIEHNVDDKNEETENKTASAISHAEDFFNKYVNEDVTEKETEEKVDFLDAETYGEERDLTPSAEVFDSDGTVNNDVYSDTQTEDETTDNSENYNAVSETEEDKEDLFGAYRRRGRDRDLSEENIVPEDNDKSSVIRDIFGVRKEEEKAVQEEEKKESVIEPEEEKDYTYVDKMPLHYTYVRPPVDLLSTPATNQGDDETVHETRKEIIKKTLEDFHINAEVQDYIQGPSITRYEIKMPAGIPVKRVLSYDDDLKMRLRSKNGVRIEAPIPGKDLVGIEVANDVKTPVGLKDIMEGIEKKNVKPNALEFAIGKNIVGEVISDNLAKGPHYLVAGATGSGKSVCLNAMIVSIIMRYSPEDVRFILIDPKRIEFRKYENLPHLLIPECISEPQKALAALSWAREEMERRYMAFESCEQFLEGIDDYNKYIAVGDVPKMPRIVIMIDELADLMESCKKDLEGRIRALAAKARAAGIHLVLATQRPSVDVITGVIKTNLPSRIALKVMNFADSSTILSQGGAEKLLGNGDMLYKNSTMSDYERYQGAYVSGTEINNVVSFIKENNKCYYEKSIIEYINKNGNIRQDDGASVGVDGVGDGEDDENSTFLVKATALAVSSGTVSISMLQRCFQIGYARAGRLVEKMEKMGFVSGFEGSKARKVLISKEEFENKYGNINDVLGK